MPGLAQPPRRWPQPHLHVSVSASQLRSRPPLALHHASLKAGLAPALLQPREVPLQPKLGARLHRSLQQGFVQAVLDPRPLVRRRSRRCHLLPRGAQAGPGQLAEHGAQVHLSQELGKLHQQLGRLLQGGVAAEQERVQVQEWGPRGERALLQAVHLCDAQRQPRVLLGALLLALVALQAAAAGCKQLPGPLLQSRVLWRSPELPVTTALLTVAVETATVLEHQWNCRQQWCKKIKMPGPRPSGTLVSTSVLLTVSFVPGWLKLVVSYQVKQGKASINGGHCQSRKLVRQEVCVAVNPCLQRVCTRCISRALTLLKAPMGGLEKCYRR